MLNRIDDYKDLVIQSEAAVRNKEATLAVVNEAHEQQVRVAKSDMEKAQLDLQTIEGSLRHHYDAPGKAQAGGRGNNSALRKPRILQEVPRTQYLPKRPICVAPN